MTENVDVQNEENESSKKDAEVESVKASELEDENLEELDGETAPEELVEEKVEEDFKAKFYYLAAEMENLRKRFDREKENLVKYGNEKILSNLLDVLDNLDRTVLAISNDEDEKVKNIYLGINMVVEQFVSVLSGNGLKEIEALGKQFDPNFHEALTQREEEGKETGEILEVFQKGYMLNGRVLRAAKVVVAK